MAEQIKDRYVLTKGFSRIGGHADVRKAVDLEADGSFVAIKFIRGLPDERIPQQLFRRETEALLAVRHPNIVKLLDSGWDSDRESYYLVLEWLNDSLADVLSSKGPYTWDAFGASIAQPLTEALAYAHLSGVIHRDIKPQNVLFDDSGTPKLADFGISKIQANLMPPGLTLGDFRSDPYTPPGIEPPSMQCSRDVFSFAVLTIQSLINETLREHDEIQPALARIDVPPDIRRLLGDCVSTDASQRPANGSTLAQRLKVIREAKATRTAAEASVIWLKLTKNAVRGALGDKAVSDYQAAATLIQRDLSRGGYAEFGFDKASQEHDKRTVHLTGYDYRITLKVHQTEPSLVVVGVRPCEDEWRDKIQRFAYQIRRDFTFQCAPPSSPRKAQAALDSFLAVLDAHRTARQEARIVAHNRQEQDELFDKWLQILEAREDLARGERRPLNFRGREVAGNGRQATFSLTSTVSIDLLGQEWEVVIPEARRTIARGEVVAQEEDSITLLLRREGHNLPTHGQLVPYLDATKIALMRQQEAIEKIKTETAVRPELRSLLLDPAECEPPDMVNVEAWQRDDLDQSKRTAVSYALGTKDFLLIEGPPGTGKTSVITEIVAQLIKRKPDTRVLIVSQTHVAVDNALERLDKVGIPGLVRLGRPEDPRVAPSVRHLLLDKAMEQWAREIRKRAERHLAEESNRLGIDQSHLRAALNLQQLANVMIEADVVQARIDSLVGSAPFSDLATGLGLTEDVEATRDLLDRLLQRKEELIKASRNELAGVLTLRDAITAEEAHFAVDALLGETTSAKRLLQVIKLQADWMLRLTSDKDLASVFLKTANVVAGTCIGFLGHPAVRDLDFDLCILDEASKATATEALVPMTRARRWILVGDTRQLPPMDEDLLRSKAKLEEYNLEPEFVATTVFDRMISKASDSIRQELLEQYRMIRPIGDMISTCFYDGKLKSPVVEGIKGYDVLWGPVSWMDTSGLGVNRFQQDGPGGGVANRSEASLVVARAKSIDSAIDRGAVKPPGTGRLYTLIIAPYRLQVDEIDRKLAGVSFQHLDVEVQSVDAVQGKESDLTIFSVTRSNPQGKFGFLGDKYWRRINVALSRARYGLMIVGDADFCRSSPGALRQVVNYIEDHPQDCRISEA